MQVADFATGIGDPDIHAEIERASIVVGVDHLSREPIGFFHGLALAKDVLESGLSPEDAVLLTVRLDPDADDIERLCALVTTVKGDRCYGED
jgi:hypothetical protein